MPRRNKRSNNTLQTTTITLRDREIPLRVTSTAGGNGGLTTVSSGGSFTSVNTVNIDPFNVGGRFALFASLYSHYRILSATFTYKSESTASGVAENVTGGTTTPTYLSRPFTWGLNKDPALSTLTFAQLIQMGGRVNNTSRNSVLTYKERNPEWMFTSTTTASPSTIDLRMVSPLQLRFCYFNNSTTASASYGFIIVDFRVQFKGILPASTALGLSMSSPASFEAVIESKPLGPSIVNVDEEKKCSPVLGPRSLKSGLLGMGGIF